MLAEHVVASDNPVGKQCKQHFHVMEIEALLGDVFRVYT